MNSKKDRSSLIIKPPLNEDPMRYEALKNFFGSVVLTFHREAPFSSSHGFSFYLNEIKKMKEEISPDLLDLEKNMNERLMFSELHKYRILGAENYHQIMGFLYKSEKELRAQILGRKIIFFEGYPR